MVKTDFVLDYPVVFSPEQTEGLTLSGKVDIALEDVKKSLTEAAVLFDGNLRSHNAKGDLLDPSVKSIVIGKKDNPKRSKGKSSKKHPHNEEADVRNHFFQA